VALLLGGSAAHATIVLPADLGDLTRGARAIVHGRVVDVRAVRAEDRRHVDTLVTLEAMAYLKGDLGATVTFRVPGGQLGRYRSVTIGAPVFEAGEEVVLFLSARGPSIPYVLGLSQGAFRVIVDPQTSDKLVVPPPLVAGLTAGPVVRGDAARQPLPLARLRDEVRRLVGGGAP
jgi:hypothetical protein